MVQVKVTEGVLEGEVVQNEFGGQFCSFKGIPYAEPPVGNLRFKAPQPKKPWHGVRSAKQFGSQCFQVDQLVSPEPFGSEDCLFLNVYTPDLNPNTLTPVMFWIHGGAFRFGSGNDDFYGPEFLVKHGVVLVTINYRLDALGFLSLETEDIPGNAGMKDQVAALRWVKGNIKYFGGDPENITIFGESAGGASTSYHLVSPMTKGLFKRAIVQSGALTCFWALTYKPRERALELAKELGCHSEDDKELAEFFKNVPLEKLATLNLPSAKPNEIGFAICDERTFGENERFFYGDPINAVRNGIHEGVEVMTGYTEDEGLVVAMGRVSLEDMMLKANEFKEFFVPIPIQLNCNIETQLEVGKKIKEYYFKENKVTKEHFENFLAFLNWNMFIHGGILLAKLVSKTAKVYLYKFTCKSERNVMAHFLGLTDMIGNKPVACHADDLFYLFPCKMAQMKVDQNSETFVYINRFTTLWTNFAKFGNPTPDDSLGLKWTPYTVAEQAYLDIGNQLATGTAPDREDGMFWDAIYNEYLPHYTALY